MESKLLVRSQQSFSVVFVSVTDLSLVRLEIGYAQLSPFALSHVSTL